MGMEITVFVDVPGFFRSNILMLKSHPPLKLKIENIFIKDISDNSKNTKIVSTIIDIAHTMNLYQQKTTSGTSQSYP